MAGGAYPAAAAILQERYIAVITSVVAVPATAQVAVHVPDAVLRVMSVAISAKALVVLCITST